MSCNNSSLKVANDDCDRTFLDFIKKFQQDSLFQFQRIKFPLTLKTIDFDDGATINESIEKEKWKYINFNYDQNFNSNQIDLYTQEIKKYGDTMRLELRGIDNGIYIDYEFLKDGARWYLISEKDYSN